MLSYIGSFHWYNWGFVLAAVAGLWFLLRLVSGSYFDGYDGTPVAFVVAGILFIASILGTPPDPALIAQEAATKLYKQTPREIGHDPSGCVTMEFYRDGEGLPIRYTRCPNSTVTTESQHSERCGKNCSHVVQDYTTTKD